MSHFAHEILAEVHFVRVCVCVLNARMQNANTIDIFSNENYIERRKNKQNDTVTLMYLAVALVKIAITSQIKMREDSVNERTRSRINIKPCSCDFEKNNNHDDKKVAILNSMCAQCKIVI